MRVLKDVDVDELHLFRGRVVEDVVSSTGSLLLPKGIEIQAVLESVPGITRTLKRWGIYSVVLDVSFHLSEEDFDKIIENIEPKIRVLEAALAHKTIAQVDEVYRRISENGSLGDGARLLARQAAMLTEEVSRAPQILLCLGRVRESDEYTFVHSLNVGLLCGYLAGRLKPGDREFAAAMTYGGLLHDLGKARVPQHVLNKPGRLTEEEYEIMKSHSVHGDDLARESGITDSRVLAVIRNHHERWNGRGYPDAFQKDKIPLFARIAAVADVFDALTAKRVYKDPLSSREAVSMIMESSEADFDRRVVRALLLSVGLYPPGTMVELSDFSVGVVVGARNTDLFRPQVHISVDGKGRRAPEGMIVDLGLHNDLFVRRSLDDVGKGVSYADTSL